MTRGGVVTRSQARKSGESTPPPSPPSQLHRDYQPDLGTDDDSSEVADELQTSADDQVEDFNDVNPVRHSPVPAETDNAPLDQYEVRFPSIMVDFVGRRAPMLKLVFVIFVAWISWKILYYSDIGRSTPDFDHGMDILERHFHSQKAETKESLRVALKRLVMPAEPGDPSSMIVLVPPELSDSSFPLCFAKIFGQVLNRQTKSVLPTKVVDAGAIQVANMNVSDIIKDLRLYFHRGGVSVVVQGIEKLQRTDHLTVFHTFSDTTHAPTKRAAFFFLVQIPRSFYTRNVLQDPKTYEHDVGELRTDILQAAWSQSDLAWDKIHPLLARVGSWGTILLREGDTCNYDSLVHALN